MRNALRLGPKSGNERELPPEVDTLATLLGRCGYHVAMKGKWHLSKPVTGEAWGRATRRAWSATMASRNGSRRTRGRRKGGELRRAATWAPPMRAGMRTTRARWRRGSARGDLPEPFCLVFSLVNPHDVLGYPGCYQAGGYDASEFRGLGVPLPPTLEEDLREKPAVQALSKLGMDTYLGPLRDRQAKQDYVDFYAHLHRVVDGKIGRLLTALGSAADPDSLRSRTVIARISDHGEMGLSHGGLRQKIFNAYEETIRVPLVISNPRMFPQPRESDALVSLLDIVPDVARAGRLTAERRRSLRRA